MRVLTMVCARINAHDRESGFTLLEVMITLAILAGSLTILASSQQGSMRAVGRSRQITVATMLARYMMADLEDELLEDGFPEMDEEDEGDFEEQGHEDFTYRLLIEKIELPTSMDAESLEGNADEAGLDTAAMGGVASAGADMIGQQFEIFRAAIEQSIRRVTLEVLWKEGKKEHSVSVATYITDPRKIDAAAGGGLDALINSLSGGDSTSSGNSAGGSQ